MPTKRPIEVERASREIDVLTPNPWFSLEGKILEGTKEKLQFVSKRIEKLSRHAGEIVEDGDRYDRDALDVRRKWKIKRLHHLNEQL